MFFKIKKKKKYCLSLGKTMGIVLHIKFNFQLNKIGNY